MIESFVGTCLLYREEISIFFDDTDEIFIPLVVAAITTFRSAHILERSTCRAGINIFVDIDELF